VSETAADTVDADQPAVPEGGWALAEDAFANRDGVVSPEARAFALARLAPRPGIVVWDVAAGSGALGVEAGRMGATVVAVEPDPGLCIRIVANASRYGVDVKLVEAEVPEGLADLPRPDSVFVGDPRPDVVRACAQAGATRIVVLVDDLARAGAVHEVLVEGGYQVEGCLLSSARLTGPGLHLAPATSDFLLWGVRRERT
jgi:precorrin-6Y C5,15-methyltransferase (decarboxylating)